MLTVAVGLTLIGFVLLVIALMNANFALAVACIAVCVVGLLVLLFDTIRANRRGRAGAEDEPLFTIRGRESASRAEPLIDDDESSNADGVDADGVNADGLSMEGVSTEGSTSGSRPAGVATVAGVADSTTRAANQDYRRTDQNYGQAGQNYGQADQNYGQGWEPASTSGLGSVVSPDAHGNAVGHAPTQGAPAQGSGAPTDAGDTGDANDYIRSVTGSFPAQTGQQPTVGPESYSTTGTPAAPTAPWTPEGAAPSDAGAPTDTGSFQAPSGETDASGYVGRRRRIEQSENVVVNTSDPTLPAMQFVYRDTDDNASHDQSDSSSDGDAGTRDSGNS